MWSEQPPLRCDFATEKWPNKTTNNRSQQLRKIVSRLDTVGHNTERNFQQGLGWYLTGLTNPWPAVTTSVLRENGRNHHPLPNPGVVGVAALAPTGLTAAFPVCGAALFFCPPGAFC